MATQLAGRRIREARRRAGLTQAALARAAGISPSYLNLIEHNRRRIGGAVLNAIAAELDARPSELAEGADPAVIQDLVAAAAEYRNTGADPASAQDIAARYPEWAALIADLLRRTRDQADVIAALSDRLTHDPLLAENVHAMLSHITAVRSTAGILNSVEDIPPLQRRRFLENLTAESERLSITAETLARFLGADDRPDKSAATSEETLDHFLGRHGQAFDALDREADAAAGLPDPLFERRILGVVGEMLDGADQAVSGEARDLVHRHLTTYARDARRMPLKVFADAAREADWDPTRLSAAFGVDIPGVFRRLAVLRRPWIEAPRFGLIVVTASGYPLLRYPTPDFALPRHGNACPLWPVFQGFARPGLPLLSAMEHDAGNRFVTYTHAAPRAPASFGQTPDIASAMLFASEGQVTARATGPVAQVGTSCRICTRTSCPARTQAALV
ncbi:XRE family transcriptional regulator [Oceanibium sediminis]|uniref:XRE family transcriptional regulator n=1 Tax=Oceanibium sediminis TaxID=2026339 RepID=UPI000DD3570B|nr:XRE family transcriptional regulator [Oceanibium sediminis]